MEKLILYLTSQKQIMKRTSVVSKSLKENQLNYGMASLPLAGTIRNSLQFYDVVDFSLSSDPRSSLLNG